MTSNESGKETAPLGDGIGTVQSRFYKFYLLDPAFEAGTLAKPPVRSRRGRTQHKTSCQSDRNCQLEPSRTLVDGRHGRLIPGSRRSTLPGVCVGEQPVNNWEQLPVMWADWPRRRVLTLARTCCCFISLALLLRNNEGNYANEGAG